MTPTQLRDRAFALARTEPHAAAAIAGDIRDPWSRAQAFGAIVRYAAESDLGRFLAEARSASGAAPDPYRRVGSAAWWLRALVERGQQREVAREVPGVLAVVPTIANAVSRIDGLFLIFQAVFAMPESRRAVIDALIGAAGEANSWKAGYRLRDAALMLAREHPDEAARVIDAMPDGKYKRQALRRIEAREHQTPRAFFW